MVTYPFYQETHGGKLDEQTFNALLRRAVAYINYQTFNRLRNYEDADNRIKYLLCDLVDLAHADTNDKQIASLSTNGESVSFNVAAAQTLAQRQEALSRPVLSMVYVDGVRSNYRGL